MSRSREFIIGIVILLVACLAAFGPALGGRFVYDDNRQIVRNRLIQDPTLYSKALTSDVWAFKADGTIAASNYWRPSFTGLSIINYRLFGLDPAGWHWVNLMLHWLVAAGVLLLLLTWGVGRIAAWLVAVVFAVHPVHVESVAWISGSPDLLFSLFIVIAMLAVERYRTNGTKWLAAAVVAYCLALGAKEAAVLCFPIFAVQIARPDGNAFWQWRRSMYALVFGAAAAAYVLLRRVVIGAWLLPVEEPVGAASAALSIPSAAVFYIRQLIFPYTLAVDHPLRAISTSASGVEIVVGVALPLAICVAVAAGIVLVARRDRLAAIGALLLVLPLVPALWVANFNTDQIVHDRYLYLSVFGAWLLVYRAYVLYVPGIARLSTVSAGAAIMLVMTAWSFGYSKVWRTDLALWEHTVGVAPNSATAWGNYGAELTAAERLPQALEAFERASAISDVPVHRLGRARVLIRLGRPADAISALRSVVDTPNAEINVYTLYQAYESLALAFQATGELAKAETVLAESIRRLPIYSAALTEKLAIILYVQGRKDEALRSLESQREAARTQMLAESARVFLRLAMLYSEMGRYGDADAAAEEFLRRADTANGSATADEIALARRMATVR